MTEAKTNSAHDLTWLSWPATWVYVVLSGLDIFLTYRLLVTQQHVEANPIARYFIDGWGLKGMIWFKLSMTAFVLALIHTLLQKHKAYARGVVWLGVAVVGGVDVYSLWLLSGR
ncbi:MAG: DUF5658 family protein [Planctomycetota bacterium]|nr:DUF5658 family protein [Planctomycetota bacterium]MDA1248052.1 DUF5658 family protein [Planctomycetota bacterium]